jgi:hypothetical protein
VQDTPAAKMSYSASVRVPAQLRALMSAVPLEGEQPQGGRLVTGLGALPRERRLSGSCS